MQILCSRNISCYYQCWKTLQLNISVKNHDVFQNYLWKRKFKRTVFIRNIILLYHCKCLDCQLIDKSDAYLQNDRLNEKDTWKIPRQDSSLMLRKRIFYYCSLHIYLSADLFSPWYFISSILLLIPFFYYVSLCWHTAQLHVLHLVLQQQ